MKKRAEESDCIILRMQMFALQKELEEVKSKLMEALREVEKSRGTCQMTGLLNKPRVYQEINHHLAMQRRASTGLDECGSGNLPTQPKKHGMDFSIVFLDIDNFKRMNMINRVFTDNLLIEFAQFLRATTRAEDVVARWGGDEFILIAMGTTREEAENLCIKIQKRMKEYLFKFGTELVHVTFSFGVVSTTEREWKDLEEIMDMCTSRMEGQKKSKKTS